MWRGMLRGDFSRKNLGDALRVPRFVSYCRALSVSSCRPFLLPSFWLPLIYSPFPFFMDSCNGHLLQLFECIESIKSDVKKKMTLREGEISAPKSPKVAEARKIVCRRTQSCSLPPKKSVCSSSCHHPDSMRRGRTPTVSRFMRAREFQLSPHRSHL
jgi:hypothetical protein